MTKKVGDNAAGQLRSFIERIERLNGEKDELNKDISLLYQQAKGDGYVPKILKQIIKIRATDKDKLAEEEAILDTYKSALGMIPE